MDRNENFLRLFLANEGELRAFIRSLVRDPHVRDDVFQEVALICWRSFDHYEKARPFGPWAKGIAANKILQLWDRSSRQPVAFSPETVEAILAAFNRTAQAASPRLDALRECIKALPEKSRQLLSYRYERSFKPEKIAVLIKATRDAVYKSLARIRMKLEDCVRWRLASQRREP